MEFKFDSKLDFQLEAINSVIQLFNGQVKDKELFIDAFIKNKLNLPANRILENLKGVQAANRIKNVSSVLGSMDFSVEMETGTGKTYVYLRTILELNQKYGFKKFIIVVPSVAIREGVLKSLEMTKTHFKQIYDNIPYNFYEYDSSKLNMIRQFSRTNNLEIMIMTIDSFNKDTTIMNKSMDKLSGERPINLVKKTNPILILDEPQNMETDIAKAAIASLNPLFKLRYSATHKNYYNLIYRLTPFDAYEKNLVKKIEVLSIVKENDFNPVFIQCENIVPEARGIYAILKLNKKQKAGYKPTSIKVRDGEDIQKKTGNPDYKDLKITRINARDGYVEFSNGLTLNKGQETGGDKQELMAIQIRQTIIEHFIKALKLKPQGIKVLSLFFIDKVSNYVDPEGFIRKTFIKEFNEQKEKFEEYKNLDVNAVHKGYFSTYKTDSKMEEDKDAYDLIMKDKERLLSFEEPTQFIFSHSALREGWDNPNIFNICVLRELNSQISRRQTIGRGIRLPVNKSGERVMYSNFNVVTVIANESYVEYCKKLQTEYEEDGIMERPPRPENARNRRIITLRKGFILNPEFKTLWNKISKRTRYAVNIDTENLVKECADAISKIDIKPTVYRADKLLLDLKEKGVTAQFVDAKVEEVQDEYPIPNLIDYVSQEISITRESAYQILTNAKNLSSIFKNPREYVDSFTARIKGILSSYLINGIKYIELEDSWKMELFENSIESYEERIYQIKDQEKTLYDGIIFDSDGEKTFAQRLNDDTRVKLFIKLPNWFVVETPIGEYNPDWAVVIDTEDLSGNKKERLYLVRETKFVEDISNLRPSEARKIECAKEHFKTLEVNFKPIKNYDELV